MDISVEQLEALLKEQKQICAQYAERMYNGSEFKRKLSELDTNKTLENKFHEIRDSISKAQFPNDFDVIKKYSL